MQIVFADHIHKTVLTALGTHFAHHGLVDITSHGVAGWERAWPERPFIA